VFFPAYTAGPIDRAERFDKDYAALATMRSWDPDRISEGLTRVGVGLFKKFVIADSLAIFSLGAAQGPETTFDLWIMLYSYAFRIYFDFSGYTDIAIGIGILFGVKMPENFNRPYLKPNIAAFWQSWHMTLSNWVRFYVYTPLSRRLLRYKARITNDGIIFISTMTTMIVIGLWHNVTLPFFIWGVWHGVGLFVHRLWSDRTRKWYRGLTPAQNRLWTIAGIVITFHFVLLGWVWFAVPDFDEALDLFLMLFGIGL
jgi:D-alanyl-lipoteichoic acid acyltransferase DltB (MBOAT superfamily)